MGFWVDIKSIQQCVILLYYIIDIFMEQTKCQLVYSITKR